MQGPAAVLSIVTYPTGALPGQERIVIDGTRGAIFEYAAGAALGNSQADNPLVSSWAASAGVDPYDNPYPEGLSVTEGVITGPTITGATITGSTISGTTFEGTDFLINDQGAFFFSPSQGVLLGSNHGSFSTVEAAVGTLTAFRGYNFPTDGIPASYPGTNAGPIPAGVTTPIISFYPPQIDSGEYYDVLGLLAGTYDTQLAAYFSSITVPDGGTVYITCFSEGESNVYASPEAKPWRNGTAAQYVDMQQHIQEVFNANAPPGAVYCEIFSSYTSNPSSSSYPLSQWVAPNMPYGIDGYQGSSSDTIANTFGTSLTQIESVQSNPQILIPETNSYLEADRPTWFTDVDVWALANNAPVMCTFWGSSPYAWVAGDAATINVLKGILGGATGTSLVVSISPNEGQIEISGTLFGYYPGLVAYQGDVAVALSGSSLSFLVAASVAGPWSETAALDCLGSADPLVIAPVSEMVTMDAVVSTDTWHDLTLGNGWSGTFRYRLRIENEVSLQCDSVSAGTLTSGTVLGTLPAGYRPATEQRVACVGAATSASADGFQLLISTAGSVEIVGAAGTGMTAMSVNGRFPLD
jgi:hypothetical protein